MVKTSQTPAPNSAPANASTPSKDIQVAALPPATATSTPATKTTTIANGATVTEQSVNAAKIYTVQIASFRKEGDAAASWQMLKTEQADLAALPHHVEKADLGKDKGIYYRLQAGSFANMEDAKSLCTSLKKRAIECMVVETKQVSMNSAPASTQPATSVQ
jgi:cell division septation protein DedD